MVTLAAEKASGNYVYFTTAEHVKEIRTAMGPNTFLAADLPIVLAGDRSAARAIGDRHVSSYLVMPNYRSSLARIGWLARDLDPPGSDRLFDEIVAWGNIDRLRGRIDALFSAGADHVVLNPVTELRGGSFKEALRALSGLVA
jgi:probable F420-dependent oxidoreductase